MSQKDARHRMSEERFAQLKEELLYLQTVREKEVSEQLKEARSFGDLSENSEYDEAKTEQGKLYSRIAELKNIIENAEIVQALVHTDTVAIGHMVTVKNVNTGFEMVYQLVGSQETDPVNGKISDVSPLGKAIINKNVGDIAEFETPGGLQTVEILKIEIKTQ